MKSNFLWAAAWLFIAFATFGGRLAYADAMAPAGGVVLNLSCDDWSYNNSGCRAFLPTSSGKAAYGEPARMGMQTAKAGGFCDDWNFDQHCRPGLREGKAAFGEPTRILPAHCTVDGNDWNYNDPSCQP